MSKSEDMRRFIDLANNNKIVSESYGENEAKTEDEVVPKKKNTDSNLTLKISVQRGPQSGSRAFRWSIINPTHRTIVAWGDADDRSTARIHARQAIDLIRNGGNPLYP